jgi:hypothetical protein
MLTSKLKALMAEIMTKMNFHSSLAGTVVWNSAHCKSHHFLDIRKELFRQSENFPSWLTGQNEIMNMLHTVVTLFGTYWIYSGFLGLLIKLRHTCGEKRNPRHGCLSLILTLFSEIDVALNPNNILKTNQKFKFQELSVQLSTIHSTVTGLTEIKDNMH